VVELGVRGAAVGREVRERKGGPDGVNSFDKNIVGFVVRQGFFAN
jgi:hypothetical protein